jgi:hypothetical protein
MTGSAMGMVELLAQVQDLSAASSDTSAAERCGAAGQLSSRAGSIAVYRLVIERDKSIGERGPSSSATELEFIYTAQPGYLTLVRIGSVTDTRFRGG